MYASVDFRFRISTLIKRLRRAGFPAPSRLGKTFAQEAALGNGLKNLTMVPLPGLLSTLTLRRAPQQRLCKWQVRGRGHRTSQIPIRDGTCRRPDRGLAGGRRLPYQPPEPPVAHLDDATPNFTRLVSWRILESIAKELDEKCSDGFLSDEQYAKLRDQLGPELKPHYVTGCETGVRLEI